MSRLERALPLTYVPYFKHNDSTRLQMACSHIRQAVPLIEPEMPFLIPDVNYHLAVGDPFIIRAPYDCVCLGVVDDKIIIMRKSDKYVDILSLYTYLFEEIYMPYNIIAREDQDYKKGDILAIASCVTEDGFVMTGANLLCGINIYFGYNYEDAIVISESAARKLTSTHYHEIETSLYTQAFYPLSPPPTQQNILYDLPKLVPLKGNEIKKGEPIVRLIEASPLSLLDKPKDETFNKDLKILFSRILLNNSCSNNILQLYPQITAVMKAMKRPIIDLINKVFSISDNVSVRFECFVKEWSSDKFSFDSQADIICKIIGYYTEQAQCGDKLTNRHGNKGCIGKIVPDIEMPYVPEFNKHLDIVLNPLGIISRMNLGQLFELHLGKIKLHLENESIPDDDSERLEKLEKLLHNDKLGELYRNKQINNLILKDNITWDEIKEALKLLTSDTDNITKSNVKFAENDIRPTAIGYMYIQKLYHRAVNKISARAVGKYSRRTLQPIHSSLSRAGQRLGEMETWALAAYDAEDLLKTMLGALSDNRKKKIELLSRLVGVEIPLEGIQDKCEVTSLLDAYFKIAGIDVKVIGRDKK